MSFPATPPGPPPLAGAGRGFVLGPDEGEAYHWLGSLTLTKVRAADTGGGLDLVDHRVPAGYAPPRHVHRESDEVFYLLDGTLEVTCGQDSWHVGTGSVVFLPKGVPHSFIAGSDRPARTLLLNAPAGFGELVVELGTATGGRELPGDDVPMPDQERVASVSARYGIEPAAPPEDAG